MRIRRSASYTVSPGMRRSASRPVFSPYQPTIDTEDVVHLLRLCFVSCDPVGILFRSFEPEEALMAAAATAAQDSWKQLQKCERKGTRKGIFIPPFLKIPSPPSAHSSNQPHHSLPSIHTSKGLLQSQQHV